MSKSVSSKKVVLPKKRPVATKTRQPLKSVKPKLQSRQTKQSQSLKPVRLRFVAIVVLVAAALVAITAGLMTYHDDDKKTVSVAPGQGAIFLQQSDGVAGDVGSTVSVALLETSGSEPINAMQAGITYPSDRLQVISIQTGSAFPQEAATDTTAPGLVRLARAIMTKSAPVKGTKTVATIQFKVLKASDKPAVVKVDQSSSLLVRSTDNQNILQTTTAPELELD